MKRILITGATGNIGAKLVADTLKDEPDSKLTLIIRGRSPSEAACRLIDALRVQSPGPDFFDAGKRIKTICGDITRPDLGLSGETPDNIVSETTHVIHSAAATKFQMSLDAIRQINLQGTRNVIGLARKMLSNGRLRRFAHISTAFVCGDREGTIFEDCLLGSPRFSNSYEQSKWEAESYVRNLISELPIVVFRPSIVVGDSTTGRIKDFNVLYTPLNLIWRGDLNIIPCASNTPLDVVPVNYVSAAIRHILFRTEWCEGKTFHIVAGRDKVNTVEDIVDAAIRYFETAVPRAKKSRVRYINPHLFHLAVPLMSIREKRLSNLFGVYAPYLRQERYFDNSNTRSALRGTDIIPPRLADYISVLLKYCLETEWGKCHRQVA